MRRLAGRALGTGAIAMATVAGMGTSGAATGWRFHADHVLGTSLNVSVVAPDVGSASHAAEAALAEIGRLDAVFNHRRPDSEVALLAGAGSGRAVSDDLAAVLERAVQWRRTTDGAFDERLGTVERSWREANEWNGDTLPSGSPTSDSTLALALDGIAKGAIIDAALIAARRAAPQVTGLLVDVGGDLACWGAAPNGDAWRVGVASGGGLAADNAEPAVMLHLRGGAVATSGCGSRDHIVAGRPYSHLLDPKTGRPHALVAGATVVTDRAVDADALATAFSVMAPERSLRLADALPNVAANIVMHDGTQHASTLWTRWVQPLAESHVVLAQVARGESPWPRNHTLEVQYEVPVQEGARYRRPYLTIWVSDADGQRVRTIELLGRRPGWQRSNYVWTRTYEGRSVDMVDAVSRPTRAPGRYTAKWDGRDDRGRPVPQGTYTIHVEAARQFGGHAYGSAELTLGADPAEASMRARGEFGAVLLRYGPQR